MIVKVRIPTPVKINQRKLFRYANNRLVGKEVRLGAILIPKKSENRKDRPKLEDVIQFAEIVTEGHDEISQASIKEWLEGTLPEAYPLWECPDKDPWGRSYCCISIADEKGKSEFRLYCVGTDGISNSGGKDLDDLNTWDENCDQWYEEKISRSKRFKSVTWATIFTTIVCVCYFLFRGEKKRAKLGDFNADVESFIVS